uniref:Shisa family member 5 n=1 Tax=Athene cunicularia TaxID=194338 RepID=A0A663MJC0_ATHCN
LGKQGIDRMKCKIFPSFLKIYLKNKLILRECFLRYCCSVVTTTTSTTVVHAPYPQQQGVPPNYPVAPYQGYQPVAIQPQPGMPVAPYPAQYPPPYPMQPSGPPAYHETMAGKAALSPSYKPHCSSF